MNYATRKLMKPATETMDFPRALVNDVKNMNAALEKFTELFEDVSKIDRDSILSLRDALCEAGRADLAERVWGWLK